MAAISSPPTRIEEPRTFHPFPRLPLELRLKIWGIRFADSTRIVDFNISPSPDPVRTLHLTHNAKLPFRGCKEECNESLRIFNKEAHVCSKLKPLGFMWPYPELDDLLIPGVFDACQIRYPRDIAQFESVDVFLCLNPYSIPAIQVVWFNLQHIGLDEVVAHIPH
jgi:hypothetical protein